MRKLFLLLISIGGTACSNMLNPLHLEDGSVREPIPDEEPYFAIDWTPEVIRMEQEADFRKVYASLRAIKEAVTITPSNTTRATAHMRTSAKATAPTSSPRPGQRRGRRRQANPMTVEEPRSLTVGAEPRNRAPIMAIPATDMVTLDDMCKWLPDIKQTIENGIASMRKHSPDVLQASTQRVQEEGFIEDYEDSSLAHYLAEWATDEPFSEEEKTAILNRLYAFAEDLHRQGKALCAERDMLPIVSSWHEENEKVEYRPMEERLQGLRIALLHAGFSEVTAREAIAYLADRLEGDTRVQFDALIARLMRQAR